MDNSIVPSDTQLPDGASVPVGPSVTGLPDPDDNLPPLPPEVEEAPDVDALDLEDAPGVAAAADSSQDDGFFATATAFIIGAALATFLPMLIPRRPAVQLVLKRATVRPAPAR